MMEIKQVFLKTRAEFGKQCIFDTCGPQIDMVIQPDPEAMINYITKTHCNVGVQHTKQSALHEAQTVGVQTKSSGMFHFEGGWPKEINPKDEETTTRFRRRVEKDEDWEPKLRNLFKKMEHNILQNGALNIYEHYFDDIIPTELVKPRDLRTVNVYEDPQTPARSVNNISWSPDSGNKMVVSYCFFGLEPNYSNIAYIWQIDNPNKPWMTLEAPSATVVSEFNPRDPSVLVSGLMSGQVCSWDVRTGTTPVQTSHRQFSHRDCTTVVKWLATKSNTEFFSGSSDGRAMWWDTRKLRQPTEVLVFDLQTPNEPQMDRAIGVASADYEPSVGTKFMFGLENGVVISGSKKARTQAEKMALRFDAHYGPILSVDRSGFNPKIFLTIGDCTARVWTEDTKDGSLVSTRFIVENPACGCWNKTRHSIFYVATRSGILTVWDLLVGLQNPILSMKLCKQKLTAIAAHETGILLAVGNSAGNVYLIESTEALYSFDKNEKNDLTSYLEECSRFVKAIDSRMKEIKLARTAVEQMPEITLTDAKDKKKDKRAIVINRNKQKMQQKPKDQKLSRVSRRKLKDESPELQEAEDKFFDIVKKEKQKYEEDEELPISPVKLIRSMKKLATRKIEKESPLITEEEKKIETKKLPKKILPGRKRTEIAEIPTTEIAQDVEEEKAATEGPLLVEAIVESPVEEISKRKRRKMAPKKRLKKRPKKRLKKRATFRLPRPCKIGICKPDICCRRIGKLKIRFADRAVKDRGKWKEEARLKDDVETRTSIGSGDKMRWRKKKSWTELLRAHKREDPTRKCSKIKGIRFLQEMMAPPEELAVMMEDVRRAKREIREISRAKTKTRELAKKALKSGAAEESRGAPRGSEKDEGNLAKEVASTTKRIHAARRGRKVSRMVVTTDPCAPVWAPPSLTKDLQTLLGGLLLEKSIEETSTARSEETKAAREGVYPRISDFHPIE
ncbi:dynein axonemal intermediate chain 2-like isoform X2 [Linepithema humile]|uniref:dynein axonemal intermediate chain 2-like isoform X2 n=1 Tax=Linepithema humile TaxID=83485 RepID=UPI00351EB8A3